VVLCRILYQQVLSTREHSPGNDTIEFFAEIEPNSSEINFSCVILNLICLRMREALAKVLCIFNLIPSQ